MRPRWTLSAKFTDAAAFMTEVARQFSLDGQIFTSEKKAFDHDVFPFKLDPPIVHIDLPDCYYEPRGEAITARVEALVKAFGGT
jgi:hypothetical protein